MMVEMGKNKKTADPELEQLEKRITAIENKLKNGKIFVLKGAADIEEIADVIEARLQIRPICHIRRPKEESE